jgi:hypothetical protein
MGGVIAGYVKGVWSANVDGRKAIDPDARIDAGVRTGGIVRGDRTGQLDTRGSVTP